MSNTRGRSVNSIGIAALLVLTFSPLAHAKTFRCDAEDVDCLIRAIREANTNGRAKNTILLAAGTYTLGNVDNDTNGSNGLPSITSTLVIHVVGTETATLSRAADAPSFRLLHVTAGGDLTLRRMILSRGSATQGGGLFNEGGVVTIEDSAVTHNGAGSGGGLANDGGVMTIANSTVANNDAGIGAGIYNNGTLTIRRSAIEMNGASVAGGLATYSGGVSIVRSRVANNNGRFDVGGILVSGGTVRIEKSSLVRNIADGASAIRVASQGRLIVTHSAFVENTSVISSVAALVNGGTVEVFNTTFARNVLSVTPGPGGSVVVIHNLGRLSLINSTLAGNITNFFHPLHVLIGSELNATTIIQNTILAHTLDDQVGQDCRGPITSLGNNLISDLIGCTLTLQPGDRVGDAGLGAFTDDGVPGHEHFPLVATSQAIDAGSDEACSTRDQIGRLRKRQCDIGAIEFKKQGAPADEGDDRLTVTEESVSSIVLPHD